MPQVDHLRNIDDAIFHVFQIHQAVSLACACHYLGRVDLEPMLSFSAHNTGMRATI
jgi:hypothetical protein